jgi:hypothetical protein
MSRLINYISDFYPMAGVVFSSAMGARSHGNSYTMAVLGNEEYFFLFAFLPLNEIHLLGCIFKRIFL